QELLTYYQNDISSECRGHLKDHNENMLDALGHLSQSTSACRLQAESCVDLIDAAAKVKELNDKLRISCSVSLY
ncbi:MAG TPA: hypothetical protein VJB13_03750, partial [Candidatus Nanoarchaeia archaeon]|nr:hypothetical protein [Candidatus Nanoarchaeia archaeon]